MPKHMILCRVKIKYETDPITNLKGEEILPGKRTHEGWTAITKTGSHTEDRRLAANMVLEAVVGPPEYQKTVKAEVVYINFLGLVGVEGEETDEV